VIDSRRFIPLLTAVGLVIFAQQAADILQFVPSNDLATPAGRIRQLLALESRTPGLLTADLLLLWALIASRGAELLRAAAGVHGVIGLLLLALLPMLPGDAASIAGGLSGGESAAFRVAVGRTLFVLVLLGIAGLLAGRVLLALRREALVRPDQTVS